MGYLKLLLCAVTLLGLTQAALPGLFGAPLLPFKIVKTSLSESAKKTRAAEQNVQDQIQSVVNQINAATGPLKDNADLTRRDVMAKSLFGSPWFSLDLVKKSLSESARRTREAEEQVQGQIQDVVNQINAATGSLKEKADLTRRDVFAKSLFGSPLLSFDLVKKSLSESARKTREAEEQVQGQIQDVVNQINAATGSLKEKADLTRRDVFARSLFGSPFSPFNLVKKSLSESAKKTRSTEEQLQDQIQEVVNQINEATGPLDSDVASLTRRGGQIFGFGGSCGQPGETCSPFSTHCCGAYRCRKRKWYHVSGQCKL